MVVGSTVSLHSVVTAAPLGPTATAEPGKITRSLCPPKVINSSGIARYERKVRIPRRKSDFKFEIQPMKRKFDSGELPPEWVACAHPEGVLYFHNESKKIITEAYLYDPQILNLITSYASVLEAEIATKGIHQGDLELVLELFEDNDPNNLEPTCGYYYADNETKTLLWLEPYNAELILDEYAGETTPGHIKLRLEALYWSHYEMFPNHRDVAKADLEKLIGILMHSSIDGMTAESTLSPYGVQECQTMIDLVKNIRDIDRANGASACVLGRLMSVFIHNRFIHNHGQHGARLARTHSIYGDGIHPPRSRLMKVLSFLFFYGPDVHLLALENMWVDQVMSYMPWRDLMSRLQDEWEKLLVMATVMLTANVSFLAIQSVDQGPFNRAPPQIASYLSTIASIGSIMLGLLLVRQHRSLSREDATLAERYICSKVGPNNRLETLAIMYTLPYALLMWGMILFLSNSSKRDGPDISLRFRPRDLVHPDRLGRHS
ncbi:hypothetical protein JAAARDRAFT_332841 [Jaapia argillacea MUCL 33604]|uniref:WW domain-containing protein n=1 Tax=Jaapia argillacea MUCL 33604 TaxID=933084 RepID=A0A067PK61_9AGAM|nr:hypothetical protein JAAARDRAFT_332841 [Jaapia argillacea MUCL 33604]